MGDTVENRLNTLDGVRKFVKDAELNISSLMTSLNWDYEYIKNEISKREECPYDAMHLVSAVKMKHHMNLCKLKKDHCNVNEKLFQENCNKNSSTVFIDTNLSASIIENAAKNDSNFIRGIPADTVDNRPVPSSVNQLMSIFTKDERKALYDYVVSKSIKNQKTSDSFISMQNEKDKDQLHATPLEELAMLRDMKRRRTKYKVATKSKSYTEVIREVIGNQMKSHCEWIESSKDNNSKAELQSKNLPNDYNIQRRVKHEEPEFYSPRRHEHKSHKSKHKKSHKSRKYKNKTS